MPGLCEGCLESGKGDRNEEDFDRDQRSEQLREFLSDWLGFGAWQSRVSMREADDNVA